MLEAPETRFFEKTGFLDRSWARIKITVGGFLMKLNYNKSDSFKTVNIDDVRIDITRNLDIQLSLFRDSPAKQLPEENVNGSEAIREVEMEAIMGVNAALITIYDLSKIVNPHLKIDNVKLLIKEGGKSGLWTNPDGLPNFLQDIF